MQIIEINIEGINGKDSIGIDIDGNRYQSTYSFFPEFCIECNNPFIHGEKAYESYGGKNIGKLYCSNCIEVVSLDRAFYAIDAHTRWSQMHLPPRINFYTTLIEQGRQLNDTR